MAPGRTEAQALAAEKVVATGRFASLTHSELAELIRAHGGEFQSFPAADTTLLVIGQDGWPLQKDGRPTAALEKARQLQEQGENLAILSEEEFLRRIGESADGQLVSRRYTISQLSRILKIPGSRLRRWVRMGLIQPVETVYRLAYFDFHQVAGAKTLCDLTKAGVPPKELRRSMEQLRQWLPEFEEPLSQISVLEQGGRLLVRLEDGRLVEPSGQLHFDFSDEDQAAVPETASAVAAKTAEAWFAQALDLTDLGRTHEAADCYLRAIELEPDDPVLHFNLGNALYALGDFERSADHLRIAVTVDPDYVEAWNNLGSVLADLRFPQEAVDAFQQALRLVPTYADAHYNLADTLTAQGHVLEARKHWHAYLQYDPESPWADEVRRQLSESM